jgi:hypothetical protein
VPFPLTVTADDVKATVVQSFGPYAVNVIVPPAAGPAVPVRLITGLAGCVAVPDSVAVSLTELPRLTSSPAVVARVGVTGLTVKHSVALESLEPGMPLAESPLQVAREQ